MRFGQFDRKAFTCGLHLVAAADDKVKAMSERRSSWLKVIERILSETDQLMSAEEIARAAVARQLIQAKALLPEESVRSAIRHHVVVDGNELGFTSTVLNK